jgi:hypothetical protein
MIINEFRYPTQYPPDLKNVCTQACAPAINPCDFFIDNLKVNLSANHGCDRAEYDIYIKLWQRSEQLGKTVWRHLIRVNLNTFTHNRTIGGNNPALAEFTIPREAILEANAGKQETQNRDLCCFLDIAMLPCYHPNPSAQNGYHYGNPAPTTPPTLPYETEDNLFLPPVGQESLQLIQKVKGDDHSNIVRLSIQKESDGLIIIQNLTWNGATSVDLCKGLEEKQIKPSNPVYPVL